MPERISPGICEQEESDCPGDHADCHAVDADARAENDRAQNGRCVVDDRRKSGQSEEILTLEDPFRRDAKSEEDRREKEDAHAIDRDLLRRAAGVGRDDVAHELRREHPGDGRRRE